MAYAHVAHDCTIGNQVVMANAATLGGHVQVDDHVILGGLVAIHQFVRIGTYAFIGGKSGLRMDMPPYMLAFGAPAKLYGPNLVGLRRSKFSSNAIQALKKSYKILFRSGLGLNEAIERVRSEVESLPEVDVLVEFMVEHSRTGSDQVYGMSDQGRTGQPVAYSRGRAHCGERAVPAPFAHAASQAGVEVVAVGFDGETDPMLSKYVSEFHLLKLGQLNRMIKAFKNAGITHAAMAGAINKTKLYARIRPDWRAVKLLNRLITKKDDFLLRALAEELESEGIHIESSTLFLPSLLAPEGILTRRKPNRRELNDINFGWQMAKAIGHLDIGQCLVVKNLAVLAVEGIDGTDATILRGGRLCRGGAVVVKVSKPIQDLRFDVPAVGYETIETMKRVGARVLVVEAGRTLVFDLDKMIDSADAAGITFMVRKDSGESALKDDGHEAPQVSPRDAIALGRVSVPKSGSDVLIRRPRPGALRVAVIGVGYLGRFHAQKYARLADADLVAVADINEAQARKRGRRGGNRGGDGLSIAPGSSRMPSAL